MVPWSIRLSRLSGSPSIMGLVCKCCRAKKKKKDSTSLTVQKLDDKSLVVVWIIPEQVTEGLLCSTPKAISQSVSYPHLIFSPQFLAFFFLKFPGPHGTQGI